MCKHEHIRACEAMLVHVILLRVVKFYQPHHAVFLRLVSVLRAWVLVNCRQSIEADSLHAVSAVACMNINGR